ncbi:MAG: aminotransferase class III-fold pyridoxal phosphate-dependent enzyme [Flammeovirgaceae bacterium]
MKPFDVYPLYPIEIVKGKGSFVWDKSGNQYLDLYGGHAVISIGHSHPYYVQKIIEQIQTLGFYSNSVHNSLQEQLAEKLGKMSDCEDYQLFMCNSGAEANENALKLASFFNGKTKVLAFRRAFHGRTSAAVAATDNQGIKAPINFQKHVYWANMNDLEAAGDFFEDGDACAVIIEGIQGVGGIYEPNIEFLQGLEKLCRRHNALLILDEIQSGYGRTGKFFAHQYAGITPDLITIAKGMGNGFPVGGVLIHPKLKPSKGMLGTTFGGNHLACAASLAVLEVLESEKLIENAANLGEYALQKFSQIEGVKQVRGKGLMIGIEFSFSVKDLVKQLLLEEKIFVGTSSQANVIRFLPPLCISKHEIDVFVRKLELVLSKQEVEM